MGVFGPSTGDEKKRFFITSQFSQTYEVSWQAGRAVNRPIQTKETTMTRQSNQIVKAALISALIVIGGASSIASASDRGHHRHTASCGHDESRYAGRITVDGYSTRIRSDRPMLRQIARAFRKAGYDAWVSNGCVRVDYGYHRPHVRWSQDGYRARFTWDDRHGELGISLRKSYVYNTHPHGRRKGVRIARRTLGWGWGYCD